MVSSAGVGTLGVGTRLKRLGALLPIHLFIRCGFGHLFAAALLFFFLLLVIDSVEPYSKVFRTVANMVELLKN
jgi:hypothetical protein